MGPTQPRAPLKQSAKRTTSVQADARGPGGLVCVKRFHGRGALDRWLDRFRAQSELDLLKRLSEADFPVPRPIEARACEGGFELVTEWIGDASTLEEIVRGTKPWPARRERVAESLGQLLARMHALGLDHPDLHAGNVLVQSDGRCTLVDVHGARLGRPLGAIRLLRDLAACGAEVRERLGLGFRMRTLRAWWHAVPAALRADLPDVKVVAAIVEARARERRREVVLRSRLRWTRTSSRAVAFSHLPQLAPASGPSVGAPFAALRAHSGVFAREIGLERALAIAREDEHADIVSVRGTWSDVRAAWWTAARLCEHSLPAPRPLVLLEKPRAMAFFAVGSARPLEADDARTGRARRRIARNLGRLVGALSDRGLVLVSRIEASILVDPSGHVLFGPGARLAAAAADDVEMALTALERFATSASSRERALFAAGFAHARRAGSADAERLRAKLRDLRLAVAAH